MQDFRMRLRRIKVEAEGLWNVVSAHEVRATVRAQLNEQLKVRQDAALAVTAAWARLEKAREKVTAEERNAGTAVARACGTVSVPELASLTGITVTDLRRLARFGRFTASAE